MAIPADHFPPSQPPSQRHHDPISVRDVFVAPRRAGRPHEGDLAVCPFCAGNERATPGEVLRAPADARLPWEARVIPNLYPIVESVPSGGGGSLCSDDGRPARGVHEVLIECREHAESILAIDPRAWRLVWRLAQQRLAAYALRSDVVWAALFKNSGAAAGASLAHVHSQLIALDFVPAQMRAELAAAAALPDPFGSLLSAARRDGRVVAEEGDLVALVPPAPRQPLETWIVPGGEAALGEIARFDRASAGQVQALADLTRQLVARLLRAAPGAAYNWWLHQAPFAAAAIEVPPGWRWHLEIMPRLSSLAGFELATGCHISTVSATESARRLRGDGEALLESPLGGHR
ncbi:MAG: DUF4921 family protein [Planctomycetota bacterium]|nr:MAG: DUF4921 family protein [Planctomycetota bacterium]